MATTKRDYYEILGLEKGASEGDIKRAYRRLAMKYHPDRVPEAEKKAAEEKFKEMSEAYAVLSDPKKREVYDQYGHSGFDQRFSTEDIFRNADFSSIFEDLGFGGGIFETLFGGSGMFGGMGGYRERARRGADLQYELDLSFEEAAQGIAKTISIPRREVCEQCRGQGGDRETCQECRGTGQIRQQAGFMVLARPCPRCGGAGSTVSNPCSRCRGDGFVQQTRKLEVKVPAGVDTGMRLRLAGEGEGGAGGRGDLYVVMRVRPHKIFQRDGNTLLLNYPINVAQAALGAEVEVPTLDGRVSMKIAKGTQSGTVLRLRGQGLPDVHGRKKGDLLVRVHVETPTNLNARQRKLLEEMAEAFGDETYPSHTSLLKEITNWFKK